MEINLQINLYWGHLSFRVPPHTQPIPAGDLALYVYGNSLNLQMFLDKMDIANSFRLYGSLKKNKNFVKNI